MRMIDIPIVRTQFGCPTFKQYIFAWYEILAVSYAHIVRRFFFFFFLFVYLSNNNDE